ncbi:unnamed protein product, partial [Mesorhabditis belari]|uniref:Short-chain dehydrogenase/reductase 3 n=1 Tax=Mesorhabditis belari TaxID=2138241 RepID=A0AAF3J960_9BILA
MSSLAEIIGYIMVPIQMIGEVIKAIWFNVFDGHFLPCKDLRGKKVLLTGGAMGLGREMCSVLARKGVDLIIWDIDEKGAEETARMVRTNGVKVSVRKVDLSSRTDIDQAAKEFKETIGEPDIIINNAGIAQQKYFTEKKDHLIEATIRVNLLSHFWIARAFLPSMLRRDSGHICSIASAAGLFGCSGMSDYSASKSGAIAFQEALEVECKVLGKNGVKFTTVCPGYIATRLTSAENLPAAQTKELMNPTLVATRVIRAIEQEQGLLAVPAIFYFLSGIKGILPRNLYQRLLVQLLWKDQQEENTLFGYNRVVPKTPMTPGVNGFNNNASKNF